MNELVRKELLESIENSDLPASIKKNATNNISSVRLTDDDLENVNGGGLIDVNVDFNYNVTINNIDKTLTIINSGNTRIIKLGDETLKKYMAGDIETKNLVNILIKSCY